MSEYDYCNEAVTYQKLCCAKLCVTHYLEFFKQPTKVDIFVMDSFIHIPYNAPI